MLEPPDIETIKITACLQAAYGLTVKTLTFLPLGADLNTAVYQVITETNEVYFLKLRRGHFPEATVRIPYWLAQTGMQQIIAPLPTQTGDAPWTDCESFTAVLAPFIRGRSGWGAALTEEQWRTFAAGLRALHTAAVPPELLHSLPRETYSPVWRNQVTGLLQQSAERSWADPAAAEMAQWMRAKQAVIAHMAARAETLAGQLAQNPPETCLCHGDIHAGNLLLADSGKLYLVDWDTLIVAPKEHDLMFIGSGIANWNSDAETEWFYQGYGSAQVNLAALAYYRYERILEDIAVTGQQLLETDTGGEDRPVMLGWFTSNFDPNGVVDAALAADEKLLAG